MNTHVAERFTDGAVERWASRVEVQRRWLSNEVDDEEGDLAVDEMDEPELLDELCERKPLAETIFRENDLRWGFLELKEPELRTLRVVEGDDGEGWRELAPDGTILSAAERIAGADDLDELDDRVPKDVAQIDRTARDLESGGGGLGPIVVVAEPGDDWPYVADGNHRATATLLHAIRENDYVPLSVYVGAPVESPTQ